MTQGTHVLEAPSVIDQLTHTQAVDLVPLHHRLIHLDPVEGQT